MHFDSINVLWIVLNDPELAYQQFQTNFLLASIWHDHVKDRGDHVNVELWFWMLVKQDRFEYHHFLNWRAGKTGSNWIYFSSNWKFGKCPVIVCLWRPFQRRRGSLVRCKKSPARSKKSLTKSKPKRVADCLWMLWHVSILPTLPFSHFHFLCRGHGIII